MESQFEHVRSRTTERRRLGRSFSRSIRDVLVGAISVSVLGLLVAFVFASPSATLRASVGPAVPRPGTSAYVLGRVLQVDGGGLQGAKIEVRNSAGRVVARGVSDRSGSFQIALHGRCSAYAISLHANALGATVGANARRRLCPGDALPIDARVKSEGHYLWVPGPR